VAGAHFDELRPPNAVMSSSWRWKRLETEFECPAGQVHPRPAD